MRKHIPTIAGLMETPAIVAVTPDCEAQNFVCEVGNSVCDASGPICTNVDPNPDLKISRASAGLHLLLHAQGTHTVVSAKSLQQLCVCARACHPCRASSPDQVFTNHHLSLCEVRVSEGTAVVGQGSGHQ